MSDLVYVSGHRNPDTDSICSAIAYSYLLNATNKYNAVPVRLGEINRETEIDIFGEYANQCIQHHKNVLEKLGFKVNIIKHLSVYTEHGEVFKGYIKNDDDKYLHIIKKENLC